jgi:hypothetical protein
MTVDLGCRGMARTVALALLAVACTSPSPRSDRGAASRRSVLAAVQATMDGLAAHDSVALVKVVLPAAVVQRWQPDSVGAWQTVTLTGAEFASRLGQPGPAFLERTWHETAWVDGDVASVTAPYDFWVDGTCSHCGVDVLTLVRDSDGTWRVATISYTVDARGEEACRGRFPDMPPSPKRATR